MKFTGKSMLLLAAGLIVPAAMNAADLSRSAAKMAAEKIGMPAASGFKTGEGAALSNLLSAAANAGNVEAVEGIKSASNLQGRGAERIRNSIDSRWMPMARANAGKRSAAPSAEAAAAAARGREMEAALRNQVSAPAEQEMRMVVRPQEGAAVPAVVEMTIPQINKAADAAGLPNFKDIAGYNDKNDTHGIAQWDATDVERMRKISPKLAQAFIGKAQDLGYTIPAHISDSSGTESEAEAPSEDQKINKAADAARLPNLHEIANYTAKDVRQWDVTDVAKMRKISPRLADAFEAKARELGTTVPAAGAAEEHSE